MSDEMASDATSAANTSSTHGGQAVRGHAICVKYAVPPTLRAADHTLLLIAPWVPAGVRYALQPTRQPSCPSKAASSRQSSSLNRCGWCTCAKDGSRTTELHSSWHGMAWLCMRRHDEAWLAVHETAWLCMARHGMAWHGRCIAWHVGIQDMAALPPLYETHMQVHGMSRKRVCPSPMPTNAPEQASHLHGAALLRVELLQDCGICHLGHRRSRGQAGCPDRQLCLYFCAAQCAFSPVPAVTLSQH